MGDPLRGRSVALLTLVCCCASAGWRAGAPQHARARTRHSARTPRPWLRAPTGFFDGTTSGGAVGVAAQAGSGSAAVRANGKPNPAAALPSLPNQPLPMVEICQSGQVIRYQSTLTSIRSMYGANKLSSRDVRLLRSSTPVLAPRQGYMLFDVGELRGILQHDRLILIGADRPAVTALGAEIQRRLEQVGTARVGIAAAAARERRTATLTRITRLRAHARTPPANAAPCVPPRDRISSRGRLPMRRRRHSRCARRRSHTPAATPGSDVRQPYTCRHAHPPAAPTFHTPPAIRIWQAHTPPSMGLQPPAPAGRPCSTRSWGADESVWRAVCA